VDIESAELLLSCAEQGPEFAQTLAVFTERLGFRLHAIFPADDPAEALLVGHGLRIRLQRGPAGSPLRLRCRDLELPALAPQFMLARHDAATWTEGRAGMRYRDLIPGRQGGRFIASHIVIPDGGPVPDYVHWHLVRLQLIYCKRGWVRVVYDNQGPPFVLEAGDCVLQPPGIRHRVLESSPGLEVVELSCPAEHETHVDHTLSLPSPTIDRERRYAGQRFVHHRAATASWERVPGSGFERRDLGIAAATDGLAHVHVLRPRDSELAALSLAHEGELSFSFVLDGDATLACAGQPEQLLSAGDAVALPPGLAAQLRTSSPTFRLLQANVLG
jgi:quercetin dioxygenase-like cupin family protein